MIDRFEPVTPAPIRFELKRAPLPASMPEAPKPRDAVRLALPPGVWDGETTKPADPVVEPRARRLRASWIPFVIGSALVHASLLFGAVYVIVSHSSPRDIPPVVTEEPTLHLDLRTVMTRSSIDDRAETIPPPEPRSETTAPPQPTVDLAVLPPLEIAPDPEEPVVESRLKQPPLSGFAPPSASAGSIVRLPARAPSTPVGSPRVVAGGTGIPALASGSPNGAPSGEPGGTGTSKAGDGPPSIDFGLLRARHIERPRYPDDARQRGDQGTVTCRLTIDRDGTVLDVEVVESSGYSALDEAAVRAMKKWRFESLASVTEHPRVAALQKLAFTLDR